MLQREHNQCCQTAGFCLTPLHQSQWEWVRQKLAVWHHWIQFMIWDSQNLHELLQLSHGKQHQQELKSNLFQRRQWWQWGKSLLLIHFYTSVTRINYDLMGGCNVTRTLNKWKHSCNCFFPHNSNRSWQILRLIYNSLLLDMGKKKKSKIFQTKVILETW